MDLGQEERLDRRDVLVRADESIDIGPYGLEFLPDEHEHDVVLAGEQVKRINLARNRDPLGDSILRPGSTTQLHHHGVAVGRQLCGAVAHDEPGETLLLQPRPPSHGRDRIDAYCASDHAPRRTRRHLQRMDESTVDRRQHRQRVRHLHDTILTRASTVTHRYPR